MKTDLTTSIILSIVGVVAAFLACNIFIGEIEPVSFSTVEGVSIDLDSPNPEVFNYRALNPTVEVYVGECIEYNANNECIEQVNYGPDSTIYTTRDTAASSDEEFEPESEVKSESEPAESESESEPAELVPPDIEAEDE